MTYPEVQSAIRGYTEGLNDLYRMHAVMTCNLMAAWGSKLTPDQLLGVQDVEKVLQEMDSLADDGPQSEMKLDARDFDSLDDFKAAVRALKQKESEA